MGRGYLFWEFRDIRFFGSLEFLEFDCLELYGLVNFFYFRYYYR